MTKIKTSKIIEGIIIVTACLCIGFTFVHINWEGGVYGISSFWSLLGSLFIGFLFLFGTIIITSVIYGIICGDQFLDVNLPTEITMPICIALIIICLLLVLLPEILLYIGPLSGSPDDPGMSGI